MSSTVDSWWKLDDKHRLNKLIEQARARRTEQERQRLYDRLGWLDVALADSPEIP